MRKQAAGLPLIQRTGVHGYGVKACRAFPTVRSLCLGSGQSGLRLSKQLLNGLALDRISVTSNFLKCSMFRSGTVLSMAPPPSRADTAF